MGITSGVAVSRIDMMRRVRDDRRVNTMRQAVKPEAVVLVWISCEAITPWPGLPQPVVIVL
jgi:hypothetical protein